MIARLAMSAFLLAGLAEIQTDSAFATDCGEPPMQGPIIPKGETATPDDLRIARESIVVYSGKVDTYLTCMDRRGAQLSPYMTKEQRSRYDEDLNAVHERRRQVQLDLNEQIRVWRRNRQNG